MVREHVTHAVARAFAPQRDCNALAGGLQRQDMRRNRLEHIRARFGTFGRKIASLPCLHIDRTGIRHSEWRQPSDCRCLEALSPLGFTKIESLCRQRFIGRRDALFQRFVARIVVVCNLREALMCSVFRQMLKCERRTRQVVKNRLEFPVEQRQPVLHTRIAPPFAHSFVKQVVRRCRAEFGDVARPEATNGFSNELEFRYRNEIEAAQLFLAALRLRIKCADCFEGITEKIETYRHIHTGRIEVKNAATHGVVARLAHGGGTDIAVELQPFDHALHSDHVAGRN